jgi:hypothetical protein
VSPIVITTRDAAASIAGIAGIAGIAEDPRGNPIPRARVALIPPAGSRGPFTVIQSTVGDEAGAWRSDRIPPGEYRLLAVDTAGLPAPDWEAPGFLREFEQRGQRVTLDSKATVITMNLEAVMLVE